ncbi:hypothetical protein [Paenibacillus segetis]|uniref:Squalene cyclase C-terminal domain-containing protein n=1 Tax=Paenibacillus segetis TaxID=1325360 RepID=A0ABQ1Y7V2_9BACL|nr:hypothetical protein [Paenibacillus segetis]GGH15792.1 hypothetical protein GCM10008013_10210 [Paenibacillus segetis]
MSMNNEMSGNNNILKRARIFIYSNARLLERLCFAYHFENGSKEAVLMALRAYQNSDGGFGNALEADMRCPQSQPVTTEMALGIMDEIECFDVEIMNGVIAYLQSITLPGGGLPRATTAVNAYPHAPWWTTERDDIPSINPTGIIIGALLRQKSRSDLLTEDWFQSHISFMWRSMDEQKPTDYHDYLQWLQFLQNTPERERAIPFEQILDEWLQEPGIIEKNPGQEGYSHKVLDYVPAPGSYASRFVTDDEITHHLNYLVENQQEDGGWPVSWPTVSPVVEQEWRGRITIERLLTLRAYGRI